MSRMLGAPLGGTTCGGQYGVESLASSLITPPKGNGGGGSCLPSMVVVALGEPGVPLISWALTGTVAGKNNRQAIANLRGARFVFKALKFVLISGFFWGLSTTEPFHTMN